MAYPAGGAVPLYGVAVSDALNDPQTSLEDLTALRDSARQTLDEQGDLAGALKDLEAEIEARKQ
jgi:uncharacterized protein DUF1843